ncbi:hypothetical protein BHC44_04335 [Snodgrassella alvi]|uniref:Phosphate ABC transporter substrate-binding protein n=1 Tax=Snodgrassella alvi TaxID=1196083 RepID=A0A2N9XTA1_9NEIS|nr:PhnD/SsuA/transferrin family substrate-binding protein [Snodgrassella alvi]PIT52464.1 hypothetical protein BHC49_13495 [Snodgrassella alvi]PIT54329.1 hypothetical protein BHC44_04335 [Snodgrassella alvi]
MLSLMVVPDYLPDQFSTWYLLNNYLQKKSDQNISLLMPPSFDEVKTQQEKEKVSMLFVNPFSAGNYVREQGYLPLVKPKNKSDEIVIVTAADSDINDIEDLKGNVELALSNNEDANFIGLRLLEPANLSDDEITIKRKDNFLMVASGVIRHHAKVGIVQADVYESFNSVTKNQLKVLLKSRINEVSHVMLYHPDVAAKAEPLQEILCKMADDPDGANVVKALGFPEGFAELSKEDMEFMIDVVDTMRM